MMTDREMMELAAKAAGIGLKRSRLDDPMCKDFLLVMRAHDENGIGWNPLTDDGDAQRLGIRLMMDIRHTSDEVAVVGYNGQWFHEPVTDDRGPATRRAIVRAAASYGKVMFP